MASTTATGKRKEPPTPVPVPDEEDILKITPLGAGNEVGRSCILLEYKGKTVMLDCGLHPAYSGLAALPFFDNIDPSTIDVLLVSHFHLDHAASLPYFLEKAIYKWLLSDYVKVSNLAAEDMLYTEQDLLRSYEKIEVVDYHQEVDVEGIKFTSFNAGHVLGAAMFLIEIAGVRVLYTGDYSREEDRHLMAAERPRNVVPEVLISESTYGVQSHQPRQEREAMFTSWVHRIVQRGGRCLIPVFALGRAQELLLILDEYWQAHSELHNVPIYYASSLAKKCMTVYQTYTNMMNERIRRQVKISNPFQFKHISNLKSMQHFDDVGPCVMMASPGMLQSGLSRELLELWCVDKRNGVIIPGYVVEGTLAKQILSQPEEIVSMSGAKLPLRLSVEYISFSAHVDYQQNSQFIDEVAAPNLVLVHGDSNEMGRLRAALQSKFHEREAEGAKVTKIYTPRNCETVELYFRGEKMAKLVGSLAAHPPKPGQPLSGVLVSRDFQYHIMAPQDLQEFTDLHTTHLQQVQSVPCRAPFHLVQWHLEMMYGFVEVLEEGSIKVFDTVIVTDSGSGILTLEWEGNAINDMVADSILAIIIQAESSPASVKATKSSHSHHHHHHKEDTAKVTSDPSVLKVDDLLSKSDKSKPATPVDESSPTAASLSKAEDLVKVKKEEVEAAYDPYTQSASAEEGNADVKVSKVEGEGVEDTKGEEEIHVDGVKIKKEPEDEETKVNPPVSASFSDAEQEEKQEEDEESGGDGKGVKDSGDDKFLPSHDPQVEGVALKKAQPNTNEKEIEHDHDHTEETLEEEREFAFYATGFLRNHFGDDGVELVGGLGARNSEGDSATEKAAQRQQQQQHQHSQKDRLRSEAIRFSKTRPRAHVWIVRTDRETAVLVLEKEKLMVSWRESLSFVNGVPLQSRWCCLERLQMLIKTFRTFSVSPLLGA
ncbi:hypothetical protein HK102_013774 [Quaeritorhiza haematococci]|nr:hypothetical protein HK102_013774 [Quaeritorhiza haematococci]